MKQNKLILLTVLIILVLYCGAVIFVTKPDSFAYEALFNGTMGAVTVPTSEQAEAKAKAEHDELLAEIQRIADKAADKAVETAVARASENAVSSVNETLEQFSSSVSELVRTEVRKAVAELDLQSEIMESAPGIVDQAVAKIESNLDSYAPAITQAVVPGLLKYEDALAADIYKMYADALVDEITKVVMAKLEAALDEASEPQVRLMTADEYEAVRQQIREDAIRSVLDSLKD